MVRLENHGTVPVFISSGISFERDDDPSFLWTGYDYNQVPLAKIVAPGRLVPRSPRKGMVREARSAHQDCILCR